MRTLGYQERSAPLWTSGPCLGDIERDNFKTLNLQVRSYILLTKVEKEKKNLLSADADLSRLVFLYRAQDIVKVT